MTVTSGRRRRRAGGRGRAPARVGLRARRDGARRRATSTPPRRRCRTPTSARSTTWARDGVPARARRLAHDGRAPHRAQRSCAAGARCEAKLPLLLGQPAEDDDRCRRRARRDPRRPAAARLHLLPPGAGARGAGRADAAARVRRRDGRHRPRVPRLRAHDGRAASPARRRRSPPRASRTRCPPADELPARVDAVAHRHPPALHDRPHRAVRRGARARRADRARARPRADAARSCCPPSARPRAARAAARPPGAARDAHRRRRAPVTPRRPGPRGLGPGARSPRPTGSSSPRSRPDRPGRFRCRRRSRRCTPRRRAYEARPTGRRSSRSTTSCCGSGRRRSSR